MFRSVYPNNVNYNHDSDDIPIFITNYSDGDSLEEDILDLCNLESDDVLVIDISAVQSNVPIISCEYSATKASVSGDSDNSSQHLSGYLPTMRYLDSSQRSHIDPTFRAVPLFVPLFWYLAYMLMGHTLIANFNISGVLLYK